MTDECEIVVAKQSGPTHLGSVDHQDDSGVESDSLAFVLARRWRTLAVVTGLVAAASGSAIWYLVKPKYEVGAIAHIAPVVRPILFRDADTDISRQYRAFIATEIRVMVSPKVILTTLGSPEVQSLPSISASPNPANHIKERLRAEQISGTQLVEVTMTGEHAEDMAVIVNSLLRTYLRFRENKKREWDETILRSLRAEQAELEARSQTKSVELRQLAVGNGLRTTGLSQTAINAWASELQQLLTEARRNSALAAAKLETLESNEEPDKWIQVDTGGFADYVQDDPVRLAITEQIKSLEAAASDDGRFGRGPAHPDVVARPKRIAGLREGLVARDLELRDLYRTTLRQRLNSDRLDAEVTARVVSGELDKLSQQRAEVSRYTFAIADVRHEREQIEQALLQVRQKIWNVDVEQNRTSRVTIDSPAIAPQEPNIDKRLKYTAAACVMSLLLGAGAALARHRLDTSVRDPVEVMSRLGMPLLGSVQYIPGTDGIGLLGDERVMEPLRGISTALLAGEQATPTHTRLITSPTARSGKSSLALTLARSLAATGRSVLLIDADNVGQGVTHTCRMTECEGLRELLEGTCKLEQVIHTNEVENLTIVPAGKRDAQFGQILARQTAQEALRSLFEGYDEVVVDSPPVLASSNAVILATLVDDIVLVLRAGRSTREEARAARHCLASVGGKIVGVILNAVNPKSSSYGYYGYGYSYAGADDNAAST